MTNPMLAELDEVVRLIGASERELVTHPALSARAVSFLRTHHATLADMARRLEAAERDSKRIRHAKTAIVEFDETIEGEHVGVIPFPHSAVGRKYKLVRIDATQEGEG